MRITDEWLKQFFSTVDENNILRRRESVSIEFKEHFYWNDKKFRSKLAKSIASFANNKGGVIVFGVSNKPHKLVGIENFNSVDDAEITMFLNNHFTPAIEFERKTYSVNGITIGLLIIFEAHHKPIICIKDSAHTFESDIYFRYGARSSKIRSGDLIYILNEIKENESNKWLDLLRKVSQFGISNVGVLNTSSGELVANNNTFILDERLLDQIKFLNEYSIQRKGAPTVKIIGEVAELAKIIEKPKAIYDEDIFTAFLTENLITDGIEYIRAICNLNTQYYPIYFFLLHDTQKLDDAYELVSSLKSRSAIKQNILNRIKDDSHLKSKSTKYPFINTELGKRREYYYSKIINNELVNVSDEKEARIFFESIFNLQKDSYDIGFLKKELLNIYNTFYPFEKDSINYTFRWSLAFLDLIEYRSVITIGST